MDNVILKTEEWFYSNVLYPRYLQTIAWTGIIQSVILLSSIVFCNFLSQPINQLLLIFGQLIQFSNIISLLSLVLLTFFLVLVHLKNVNTAPKVATSLWMRVTSWANLERVFYIACFVLIYVLQGTFLANLCGFNETLIAKKNNYEKQCLAEKPIAMTTLHLYIGMVVGISYFKFHHYSVRFENVMQLKVYTIKIKLREAVKICGKRAFFHLLRFMAGYFTAGSIVKLGLVLLNDVSFCNGSFVSFATIRELFSYNFILISLVTTYIGLVTWEMISILSQVFLTERCEFSLDSNLTSLQFCQLTNAIKCDNCPLMKYLALLDLKNLTENSTNRRSHIFTVSLPGGHPHTWNIISNENLSAISSFTSSLYDILAGKVKPTVEKMKIEPRNNNSEETNYKKSPSKLRNIADDYSVPKLYSTQMNFNTTSFLNTIFNTPNMFLNKIKLYLPLGIPMSFLRFLTVKYVDKNLENAFYSCQPVIWSIQALTSIVIASRCEDKYGVVQWSLGNILVTFLELNTVLEKIVKPKRNGGVTSQIWQNQQSLKMAVNNGLYRIVAVFHSNLNYLDLTEEQIQRLQCYKI